jgi:hypothetical protein
MEDVLDEIYESEQEDPTQFIHGQRYLGVASPSVLLNTVQAKTFFKNTFTDIVHYLYEYSIAKPFLPPRILQLIILDDDTYAVCDKTFWLRLVQRRWKSVLNQRRQLVQRYPSMILTRLLGQQRIRGIPELRGMLTSVAYTRIKIDSHLPTNRRECLTNPNLAGDPDNDPN